MRYIITGVTGLIGRSILKELLLSGNEVTAIVRPNSKKNDLLPLHEKLCVIPCDMENIDCLNFGNHDIFLHLAWQGTTGADRNNKLLQESNIRNSLKAFHLAEEIGCKVFFFAGSQAEYGNILEHGFQEQLESNLIYPKNEYGASKASFGKILEDYSKKSSMKLYHGRIFSVYGPEDQPNSLIQLMIRNLSSGEMMALGPCEHDWNFTFSKDIANIILALVHSDAPSGTYNLASHDTRPLKDFVNIILNSREWKGNCIIGARSGNPNSDVPLRPNVSKLNPYCSITETSFEEGIKKTIEEHISLSLKKK